MLCRTVSLKDKRRKKGKKDFSDRRVSVNAREGQRYVSSPRKIFSSRPSCFPYMCVSSSKRDLLGRYVFRGRPGTDHPRLNVSRRPSFRSRDV